MLPSVKTILYCTDLGKHTRPAFRMAVSLARQFDARIVFLHVIEPLGPNAQYLVDAYLIEGSVAEIRRKGIAELKEFVHRRIEKFCAEELDAGIEIPQGGPEQRVAEGAPARVILQVADEVDADLIVMGTHSHSAVGELLLGSVAHKVSHQSRRPVLLVPLSGD